MADLRRDETFFFGPTDAQRYGSVRRADSAEGGTLVFAPLGPAYMSAHRAIGALIDELVGRGRDVMRFDPFAHGDSAGAERDALPVDWEKDVDCSFDEAKRRLGSIDSVVAFGLSAAFLLARPDRFEGISRCALVDPNLSGREFIVDLERRQKDIEASTSARWTGRADDGDHDLLGYDFSGKCRRAVTDRAVSVHGIKTPVLAISTKIAAVEKAEEAILRSMSPTVETVHFPPAEGLVDDPFRPRVPQAALRRVADFLCGALG